MSITNSNNISGYIGNVQNSFFNDSINPQTNPGVLGDYVIDTFVNNVNLNLGDTTITNPLGSGSWNFNVLDLLSTQNPSLNIQINDQYDGTYQSGIGANIAITYNSNIAISLQFLNSKITNGLDRYGVSIVGDVLSGIGGQQQMTVNLGGLYLPVSEIASWYQNHPYDSARWNTKEFWDDSSGNPPNAKMLDFYNILIVAGNLYPQAGSSTLPVGKIPTTFDGFLSALKGSKTLTVGGVSLPGQNLISAIKQQVQAPTFNSTDSQLQGKNLLNTLFAQYIQNYQSVIPGLLQKASQSSGSALITNVNSPEALATGWYQYLQEDLPSNFIESDLPVKYTDSSNSFFIDSGSSVSLAGANKQILATNTGLDSLSTFVSTFVDRLQQDFYNQVQYTTDFAGIASNLPGATQSEMFDANFATFMNYMLGQGGQTTVFDYQSFIQQWNSFVGPVAILNSTGTGNNSQNLLTYLKIYNVFYPSGDPQHDRFMAHLSSFVNRFVGATGSGIFNPSLMIDQWFKNLVNKVYSSNIATDRTNLGLYGGYEQVRILNALYRGLASMVESLQVLTVAQATRLELYSDRQELYTKLLKKIPIVIQDPSTQQTVQGQQQGNQAANIQQIISTSPINGSTNEDAQARSDFNGLSAQYTTNVQAFRSQSTAQGNQFQAAFSQSNQAVNEMIAVATKILQVVNAIASSIFQQTTSD